MNTYIACLRRQRRLRRMRVGPYTWTIPRPPVSWFDQYTLQRPNNSTRILSSEITGKLACSGSRSVRTIEKASGRQAGSAASGIREGKGEDGRLSRRPFFLYQTPLVPRPLFQSSTLTESLEQATAKQEHF